MSNTAMCGCAWHAKQALYIVIYGATTKRETNAINCAVEHDIWMSVVRNLKTKRYIFDTMTEQAEYWTSQNTKTRFADTGLLPNLTEWLMSEVYPSHNTAYRPYINTQADKQIRNIFSLIFAFVSPYTCTKITHTLIGTVNAKPCN